MTDDPATIAAGFAEALGGPIATEAQVERTRDHLGAMQKDRFEILRPAEDRDYMPARSFTIDANEYVPDDRARAVKVTIWQDASARTGHTVVKGEFNLSLQERKDLIAFLQALPDANHPF